MSSPSLISSMKRKRRRIWVRSPSWITLLICISINIMSWHRRERPSRWNIVENRLSFMIEIKRLLCQRRSSMIRSKGLIRRIRSTQWLCLWMRSTFLSGLGIWRKLERFRGSKRRSDSIRILSGNFFQWTIWTWLRFLITKEASGARGETLLLRRPKVSS